MTLTAEQVKEIEAGASRYGCGAWDCVACYPLQYRCDWCGEDYASPILNGQRGECEACGEITEKAEQPTDAQIEFWKRYQTVIK